LALAVAFAVMLSGAVSYSAESPQFSLRVLMYEIQRGDTLTRLAKRFKRFDITVDALFEANKDGGCVKSKDLILAGCTIAIPNLVMWDDVWETIQNYEKALDKLRTETRQAEDQAVVYGYLAMSASAFAVIMFLLWYFTKLSRDEWKEKAIANSKRGAIISILAVLAVFLTFGLGFAQTSRPPTGISAGISGHVATKLQASPSVRLKNVFGSLEHSTMVVPWGSSFSRLAATMGQKGQKEVSEWVGKVVELNKDNPCVKSRDLVWEGCEIKIPVYPARETEIRFAASDVVNDALENKMSQQQTELTQTQAQLKQSRIGLGILSVVIVILLGLLVFVWMVPREVAEKIAADRVRVTKAENDKLVETVSKLYVERDCLEAVLKEQRDMYEAARISSADAQSKVQALESVFIKYAACAEGAPCSFESRDNGVINNAYKVKRSHIASDGKPVIDFLECVRCGAEVLQQNCGSHYFKPHENLTA